MACPNHVTYRCTREDKHDGPCAGVVVTSLEPEVVEAIGWLLELKLDDSPAYVSRVVHRRPIFVSDVDEALRFSRKQDAESFMYDIDGGSILTPTEHLWL